MTIKEIETLSGLTRANIRFYEAEGLLTPVRNENGYRDYSDKDLEILKKIKLLRMLHISLEEIKALQSGEQELAEALDQHIKKLSADKTDIERSQKICKEMRDDGAVYETLDAERYLENMEQERETVAKNLAGDVKPHIFIPWRRFFARMLDLYIYRVIWLLFLAMIMNIQVISRQTGETLIDTYVSLLLMLGLEPLLLSKFGTTLGKWIFGIRIYNNDGGKLSYQDAFIRTRRALWRGMGTGLPIYILWREFKSYQEYAKGTVLEWEYDSEMVVKDKAKWRIGVFAAVHAAVVFIFVFGVSVSELPKNRGDITVAEFCENYNRYLDYYDIDSDYILDSNGEWEKKEPVDEIIVTVGGEIPKPEFVFTEKDGYMTGLTFEQELKNCELWWASYQTERILAIMSFALAQDGVDVNKRAVNAILNEIENHPLESFAYEAYGVTVTCDISCLGYEVIDAGTCLFAEEGANTEYSISFSMSK